jgi:DNA invertase Pin-like site-specific DNA recombinase
MRRPRQVGSSSIEPNPEAKRAHRGSLRKSTREPPANLAGGRKIRCAIYTRKSSEQGREQEFNPLDAQREACEAFVRSQKHEGWSVLPQLYDDPGYSGGTMERPALKRLFADIATHRIDAVVVYKVGRLTRSLSDFAKIVEDILKNIVDAAASGAEVSLRGFGKFKVKATRSAKAAIRQAGRRSRLQHQRSLPSSLPSR